MGLARLGRCPSQCKESKPKLRDLSKPTALLTYLTLVGHLNKIWLVILQGTLVGHLKSIM